MVVLQHRLKNVHDEVAHPKDSTMFKHASTLNYVGNLIFRIAHNFIFFFLTPRQRVHREIRMMRLAEAKPRAQPKPHPTPPSAMSAHDVPVAPQKVTTVDGRPVRGAVCDR